MKADVVMPNRERIKRTQGTPQGAVVSPLITNIFLHLGFDSWMQKEFPCINFERYADDIVVHCRSQKQLEYIEQMIR